ncbi:MAG: uracil-DNA glycosylase [Candidatus Longimicrobiales bacterium M2_2A_002]
MDERDRLAGVLRQLRELGLSELYLDDLTADEAVALLSRARRSAAARGPEAAAGPGTPVASKRAGPTRTAPVAGESIPGAEDTTTDRLAVLSDEAAGCVKCRLSEGRTQVVFGRGSADAELVVVGEAPGRREDETGLPFVGPAGKLLDLLLLSVGIERGSAYICNVLKCRPPNNRDPLADEVETCAPYLHAQLDIIRPRVLLAVGKFAAQWLSGREQSVGRLRGSVHEYRGVPVVATYHPAYLLRSPHATRRTWQDLQLMRQVLDEHT